MREPVLPQLTGEEFLGWEARQRDRFELHHGFVVAFAGGTIDHDAVGFRLRLALARAYGPPCRTFGSDVKVQAADDVFYYADAGVICEPIDGRAAIVKRPKIVAEVLSESTRTYDLVEKRNAHRSMPSVTMYLIVHTRLRRIEIDVRIEDRWQTSVVDTGSFTLGSIEEPLDELYEGTSIE